MEYLLEVLKIVDGGLKLNPEKVKSYAELLADKLETVGESKAALRIRQALAKSRSDHVATSALARLGKVPVDSESRISLADEEVCSTEDVNVFIEPNAEKLVNQFLSHLEAADKLVAEGVGIAPSMLMYGPPGCGKTELGRYIAASLGLPLITARTDGLISSYLGNTAKNLRTLFEYVMGKPCILFLDEFDAIAKLRDDQHELGELKRVVVSLLQNIDALDNNTILIAATNHEHLLDPAIWRRFAYKAKIDMPIMEVRRQMFHFFLGGFASQEDCHLLAAVSDGMTGADIRQVAEDSKREAILADSHSVSLEYLFPRTLQLSTPNELTPKEKLNEQISQTRQINTKIFTYKRLAKLFGVSTGKICSVLKNMEATENGFERPATHKDR